MPGETGRDAGGIDYYHVLQADPAAEPEVLRAAYRALATKYHPDREGGSADRMIAINRAWDVLGNPVNRATYDKPRHPLAASSDRRGHREPVPDTEGGLTPRPWGTTQRSGTVLDFGRYAGWSFPEIARQDPDFLRWLARMPMGARMPPRSSGRWDRCGRARPRPHSRRPSRRAASGASWAAPAAPRTAR